MPFLCSQPLNNYLLICPQIILCAKHRSIAWWCTWIHDLLLSKCYYYSSSSNVLLFSAQVVAKPCREQIFLLDPSSSHPSTTFLSYEPSCCHTETVLHKYQWNEWAQTPQKLIQEFHSSQFGFISTPQPGSALSVGSGVAWVLWGES